MRRSEQELFREAVEVVVARAVELAAHMDEIREALGETSEVIEPLELLEDAVAEMAFRQEMTSR